MKRITSAIGAMMLAGAVPLVAAAQDARLPNTLFWTTYDTGGSNHATAVALSSILKKEQGVNMRILTAGNGTAQQTTLRIGKSDFVLAGFDVYFAQEGAVLFGTREWGPQPVRLVVTSNPNDSQALAVDPALGITHPSELKGLRIAYVEGSTSIDQALNALIMGCGGLDWSDVEKVSVPGFGASVDAYINDDVDVYYTVTGSSTSIKADSSSRGLGWVPIPHDDEACWSAIRASDPRWIKKVATEGVNVPSSGIELAASPDMILNTYADRDAGYVHAMVKAIYDNFETFKASVPKAYGFATDRQLLPYVVPYHDGAVQYFKEAGLWSDEAQKEQDRLIERQNVLKAAWDEVVAQDISDDADFAKAWQKLRRERLEEAGFSVTLASW